MYVPRRQHLILAIVILPGIRDEAAEVQLQRRCRELDISLDAFSALQYVGTRTTKPPTDFNNLLVNIKTQMRNINVRSPRKPAVVFSALKVSKDNCVITLTHRILLVQQILYCWFNRCLIYNEHLCICIFS